MIAAVSTQITAGRGHADAAQIFDLSLRVSALLKELDFRVRAHRASHFPRSPSRYLEVECARGHIWLVRVSNHLRPVNNEHPTPHLNFVSVDGASGLEDVRAWALRVAAGELDWTPNRAPVARPRGRKGGR